MMLYGKWVNSDCLNTNCHNCPKKESDLIGTDNIIICSILGETPVIWTSECDLSQTI
jgi:hypothetical protein